MSSSKRWWKPPVFPEPFSTIRVPTCMAARSGFVRPIRTRPRFTHKAARLLKALLEVDDSWSEFCTQTGQTKFQTQPTL